jgi:hypothetical protein
VRVVTRYFADRGIVCTREEALGKANWRTKKGGLSAKGVADTDRPLRLALSQLL